MPQHNPRSGPVRNGYVAELALHKEELQKACNDDDVEGSTMEDLQERVDTAQQVISNYTAAAASIAKLLAAWYDEQVCLPCFVMCTHDTFPTSS